MLVVPANEELVGTSLAYFPIGGPVPRPPPPGLKTSLWGGMEAGNGLLYACQVVDGAVHEAGGRELLQALASLPADATGRRCREGHAVSTPSPDGLRKNFAALVHTVPPFFSSAQWEALLESCYERSLGLIPPAATTVAFPLLGAGARGASVGEASRVAAAMLTRWQRPPSGPSNLMTACFGCIDSSTEHELQQAFLKTGSWDLVEGKEASVKQGTYQK